MPVDDAWRAAAADQGVAISPRTDPALLAEIAQHRPDLRPALAMNPAAYPALLDWLAGLDDPVINAALAARRASTAPGPSGHGPAPVTSPSAIPGNAPTSSGPLVRPRARKRLLPVLATVVVMAAVGISLAWKLGALDGLGGSGEDGLPTGGSAVASSPTATPATTAEPTASVTSATTDPVEPAEAPDLTDCREVEWASAELAAFVAGLGSDASDPAALNEVSASFTEMEAVCGVTYAADVAQSLTRQPGISGDVQQAAASYAAATVRFPAPPGSVTSQRIDSPQKNISCELEESSVGCSILDRSYPVAEDCPDRLYSAILTRGSAQTACGTEWLGEAGDDFYHISYGETVTFGFMACTVEPDGPRRGMTCWDTRTGHSFRVSRAIAEIDNSL